MGRENPLTAIILATSIMTECEGIEPPKLIRPNRFQDGFLDQPDTFHKRSLRELNPRYPEVRQFSKLLWKTNIHVSSKKRSMQDSNLRTLLGVTCFRNRQNNPLSQYSKVISCSQSILLLDIYGAEEGIRTLTGIFAHNALNVACLPFHHFGLG